MRETIKRSFTLLELIIVVIILGVLATLGIQQYMRMIERARGAEAKTILGNIRTLVAAYRLQNGSLAGLNSQTVEGIIGLGMGSDQIPVGCLPTHYFWYLISYIDSASDGFTARAIRCTSNGKLPNVTQAVSLSLGVNFATGNDTWWGNGGY